MEDIANFLAWVNPDFAVCHDPAAYDPCEALTMVLCEFGPMESIVEVTEKVLVVILTAVRVDAIRVDVFTEPAIGLLVNRVDTDKVDTPNVLVIVLFIVTVEPVSVDKLN